MSTFSCSKCNISSYKYLLCDSCERTESLTSYIRRNETTITCDKCNLWSNCQWICSECINYNNLEDKINMLQKELEEEKEKVRRLIEGINEQKLRILDKLN